MEKEQENDQKRAQRDAAHERCSRSEDGSSMNWKEKVLASTEFCWGVLIASMLLLFLAAFGLASKAVEAEGVNFKAAILLIALFGLLLISVASRKRT